MKEPNWVTRGAIGLIITIALLWIGYVNLQVHAQQVGLSGEREGRIIGDARLEEKFGRVEERLIGLDGKVSRVLDTLEKRK